MQSKSDKIIEAARALFSEKGYKGAAVQEIADQCGISKGAIYLHFRSKNDLLMAVMDSIDREIKGQIEAIRTSASRSPKERLREQIIFQFSEIISNQSLIETFIRDSGLNIDDSLLLYLQRVRYEWQKIQEDFLSDVYGAQIDHILIDLAVMVNGVINEYYALLLVENLALEIHQIADFLMIMIDQLVKGLLAEKAEPVLTREMMPNRVALEEKINRAVFSNVREALRGIEEKVKMMPLAESERAELQTVLDVLNREMEKEAPNKILIQGMLANFRGYKDLTPGRKQIVSELKIKLL